jgi:hypothetical protein
MIDISPSSQCGVLDVFWGRKWSAPEYFRQFNSPTVILARKAESKSPEVLGLQPGSSIYSEGDNVELDWVVSHFQPRAVENGSIAWQLIAGAKVLANGRIDRVDVPAGSVAVVGRSRIAMPSVARATKAKLIVTLDAATACNSWNVWIFPRFHAQPDAGKGMAASPSVFDLLAPRYPGLAKLGTPEANDARLIVARTVNEPGVAESLEQGKRVLCLSLPRFNPLKSDYNLLSWATGIGNQTGTAIARHPAFGDFPHDGYLDQGWFRLVDTAEKLDPGHKFRTVEPLMVGIGRESGYQFGTLGYPLGFNLYAFQARVGRGKLLSSGLKLISDNPEAVYLLDQFIRYAGSEQFAPKGTLNLATISP